MDAFRVWPWESARRHIRVPGPGDDKYSRGVLGMITGSKRFPGAAVLGVEAALHTGVGMVRFCGPAATRRLVLQRRPEVVTQRLEEDLGRVEAWLLGSGMSALERPEATTRRLVEALSDGSPVVLDAGALDLVASAVGPTVITPHYRELARLTATTPERIAADPGEAARSAASAFGVTVLVKGHHTYIAAPDGTGIVVQGASPWLATAGTGDALGGILGAMAATHAQEILADAALLPEIAASAVVVHSLAAQRAGAGGPFTVLELAAAVSPGVAGLLVR
jgi:hydroxyethylthiazole kinase-like uncharacterized protein yjeF